MKLQQFSNMNQHDHDHEDFLRLSLSTGSSSSPSATSFSSQPQSPSAPPFETQPSLFNQEISHSLSSSTTSSYPTPPSSIPIPFQNSTLPHIQDTTIVGSSPKYSDTNTLDVGPLRKRRMGRRSSNQILRPGKAEAIPAPYPWATTKRATVHSLQYLQAKGVNTISGKVQCKRCERQFDIEYNLHEKFAELAIFIVKNKEDMRQRAPVVWMNPTLPDCKFCEQNNCVKPILSKKKSINWLFLLLGQMIGCCKLSELKYFCKHTRNHRTGAKDRVLYLAYLELCRQLDPEGSYVR